MKVVDVNSLKPEPRESKKRCKTCSAPLIELYSQELGIVMGYEPCEHKRLKEMPAEPIQAPIVTQKSLTPRIPEPDPTTSTAEEITKYVMSLMGGRLDDSEGFLDGLAAALSKQSYTLHKPKNATDLWMMIQIGLGNLKREGNWNQWYWIGGKHEPAT